MAAPQFAADALQHRVDGRGGVLGDAADVGRHDRRAEVHGEVDDGLGAGDAGGIAGRIHEVADVAAEGGEHEPLLVQKLPELPPRGIVQEFGGERLGTPVDLNAFGSHGLGGQHALARGKAERIDDHADLERLHLSGSSLPGGLVIRARPSAPGLENAH